MSKTAKRVIAFTTALSLTLGITLNTNGAKAAPNTEIQSTKNKIEQITKEMQSVDLKIKDLDLELNNIGLKLTENSDETIKVTGELENVERNIESKNQELSQKNIKFDERLRSMYKNNSSVTIIGTIFKAKDFSDLMMRTKVIMTVAREDRKLIDSITDIRNELVLNKQELTNKKEKLVLLKNQLEETNKKVGEAVNKQKDLQVSMDNQKQELSKALIGQEVALLNEAKNIINNTNSSETQVDAAMKIVNACRGQVSTPEALALVNELTNSGTMVMAKFERERVAKIEAAKIAEEQAQHLAVKKAEEEAAREAARVAQAAKVAPTQVVSPVIEEPTPTPVVEEPTPTPAPVVEKPAPTPVIDYSRGERVAREAKNYLGVRYVFGGESYNGVDCSGLTMLAYRAVGIYLAHSADTQYFQTRRVYRSDLAVGDIVFYSDRSGEIVHCAIYVGGGLVVHAPEPGRRVEIRGMQMMTIYGFGRP